MVNYAVVLTFPGDVAEELNKLRSDYNQYVRYRIEPHLTLVYPFLPLRNIDTVDEKLAAVGKRTKPFTLILDGIGYFEGENNVVYAAIEDEEHVKALHNEIMHSLSELIKEEYTDGQYDLDRFVPHVTLGEQIPDELLPSVKERFATYKLHNEVEVSSFVLVSAGEDGVWKRNRSFGLSG
jgi:2'-5' RNA ligase